ncbi:hypothetical protein GIB67_037296 [Kingdonia uniflora]|uniref:Uncharacterized protein n=1 Tax=Kingdonia uniflora TaxID=39325 RepID=A0A7J7MS81_9MAGN|nr:hypothetical protein GIB67_037296 [Kingdonia uniflora]
MAQNRKIKLNILVTGTPSMGKTTMSSLLADAAQLRHINVKDVVKKKNLYDGWDENLECHFINEDLSTSQSNIKESGNRTGREGTLQPDFIMKVMITYTKEEIWDTLSVLSHLISLLTMDSDPFYALLEAFRFTAHWLPFCKIFNMEPGAPKVYFTKKSEPRNDRQWLAMKKLNEEINQRIKAEVKRGMIS